MELRNEKIVLRDPIESDIDDRIRWETAQTEWLEWDAPWETEEKPFVPEDYRRDMKRALSAKEDPNRFRYGFQICTNDASERHIGWVNAYRISDTYCYTHGEGKLTIGIDIPDESSRRKGYATEAWALYISYLLRQGIDDVYTQTWSGNHRVLGLINKLGFEECDRRTDFRRVRGTLYDGLTFRLNLERFNHFWDSKR